MSSLFQLIAHQALIAPTHIALDGMDYNGQSEKVSYEALINRIDEIANQIKTLSPNCIALRADNSIDWAMIDLAALKCQVPIVPVPLFFSEQQVNHLLNESGADVLIGQWDELSNIINLTQTDTNCHMPVYRLSSVTTIELLPQTLKITFTSGSTGAPKGVCLSEDNLVNITESLAKAIGFIPKKHLCVLPLSTLLENITGIYVPLILGATSCILHSKTIGLSGSSQLDLSQFHQTIRIYQPNTLVLIPALLQALVGLTMQDKNLSSSLQFVAVGGARVSPALLNQAKALGIPVYEGYGLSECASVVCLNTLEHNKIGTCGRPLSHVEVRLDEAGELFVRGNIALGYIGHPFTDKWLATGDLATLDDDGFYTIIGRKKNLIITSFGRNISPEWIEYEVNQYFPLLSAVITGEAQSSLSLIIDINEKVLHQYFNGILDHLEHALAVNINKINQNLPDYAQIKQVYAIKAFTQIPGLFTQNNRAKREAVHRWLQSCDIQSHSAIHMTF